MKKINKKENTLSTALSVPASMTVSVITPHTQYKSIFLGTELF